MCDCYTAPCGRSYCWEQIDIHLGNGETARHEIAVFCADHAREMKIVKTGKWQLEIIKNVYCTEYTCFQVGRKLVYFAYLTLNAVEHRADNEPNNEKAKIKFSVVNGIREKGGE